MHKMRLQPGLCPGPHRGSIQRSSNPLVLGGGLALKNPRTLSAMCFDFQPVSPAKPFFCLRICKDPAPLSALRASNFQFSQLRTPNLLLNLGFSEPCYATAYDGVWLFLNANLTRAKQAQACNTATCLRISDIFTYLFRYLLIHSITY